MSTSPGSEPTQADADVLRVLIEQRREFELELASFQAASSAYVREINRSLRYFQDAIRRTKGVSIDVHELRKSRPHIPSTSSKTGHGVSNFPAVGGEELKTLGSDGSSAYQGGKNQTEVVLDFMERLVRELMQPVSKRLLMERLEAAGQELAVTDPKKFVQKALWRSKKFVYLEQFDGWWLVGEPLPAPRQ